MRSTGTDDSRSQHSHSRSRGSYDYSDNEKDKDYEENGFVYEYERARPGSAGFFGWWGGGWGSEVRNVSMGRGRVHLIVKDGMGGVPLVTSSVADRDNDLLKGRVRLYPN